VNTHISFLRIGIICIYHFSVLGEYAGLSAFIENTLISHSRIIRKYKLMERISAFLKNTQEGHMRILLLQGQLREKVICVFS